MSTKRIKRDRKDFGLADAGASTREVSMPVTRLYHWMELLDKYGRATPAWLVRQSLEDVVLTDLADEIEASLQLASDIAEETAIIQKLMNADGDVW
jgi:hypothetical protein